MDRNWEAGCVLNLSEAELAELNELVDAQLRAETEGERGPTAPAER